MAESKKSDDQMNISYRLETDWLASTPVFYNVRMGLASTNIHDVMPSPSSLSLHPEGLYNYLDFGYSVFGQTPIEGVQFLSPSSRIDRKDDGTLNVVRLADPLDHWWDFRISEADVIDLIRERVQKWETSLPSDQEIVLPLSGGFDSRLLLWCLKDKSRIRAYTYGISQDQDRSMEVVHARALARKFDIRWERVELGSFHRYFNDWDAEFGVSIHAHGMYHFEFYSKIRESLKGKQALLSGIIGDAWAGSIPVRKLSRPDDLLELGHTHGLRADPDRMRLTTMHQLKQKFWLENRNLLGEHRFQVITSMHFKLMLLSYLMRVPRLFNFAPWTPYLDIDIAMAMLNLPPKRRRNRQWQRDFFANVGLDLENQGLISARSNNLNFQALRKKPLQPLNKELMSMVIDSTYVDWINEKVKIGFIDNSLNLMCAIPKIGGGLRRLKLCPRTSEAYCAYLCMRPIQKLMER